VCRYSDPRSDCPVLTATQAFNVTHPPQPSHAGESSLFDVIDERIAHAAICRHAVIASM